MIEGEKMTKNVFEDFGFSSEESKDLVLRTSLLDGILKTIERHSYSQKELQLILNVPQSEISHLVNGKISKFSSDKLIKLLDRLGAQIELSVKVPRKRKEIAS